MPEMVLEHVTIQSETRQEQGEEPESLNTRSAGRNEAEESM